MTRYAVLASYTDHAAENMLVHPADRAASVTKLIEAAGGRMESFDWMFGPYDVLLIVDLPDAQSMAAAALAVLSTRAVKTFETYELIPHSDISGIEDKARALTASYRPPGQEG